MQEITGRRISDVELDGIISFEQTGERVACIVYDVSLGCAEIDVFMVEPRGCAGENVELNIFLPTERTPVKCSGKIGQHPEDVDFPEDQDHRSAQIVVAHISRMDLRRFEIFAAQKMAFISSGRSQVTAL